MTKNCNFAVDLNCDELDLAEIAAECEDQFDITLSDMEERLLFSYLETVSELVDFIAYKVGHTSTKPAVLRKNRRRGPQLRASEGCGGFLVGQRHFRR